MILSVPEKDLHKTLTSVMKDISAADRKRILEAVEKVEAKEEREELRFTVLRLIRSAPEKDLEQNLANIMKDVSTSDRKKICAAIEKMEAGSKKDALRIKVAELMMDAGDGRAIAAVMKDLSASDRAKILEAIERLEGPKTGASKDALAAMAADLLVAAAESGELESTLTEVFKERREASTGSELRDKVLQLLQSAQEKDLPKALAAVMKELSPADKTKIQEAMRKVEGDPDAAFRLKIAELMLTAPQNNLEQALAAVMKDLSASDIQKIRKAVKAVEVGGAALTLSAKFLELLGVPAEKELPNALADTMKDLSDWDRKKIREAMATVEADPKQALRLKVAELLLAAPAASLEYAMAAVMKDVSSTDRQKIIAAIDHVEAFEGPIIMKNEMMNASLNSFGMQPGVAIL